MAQDARQYGSTAPIRAEAKNFPNAASEFDKARLASYRLYEDLYMTNSADYKVVLRGGEEGNTRPIYVPNGEKIIEAKCRFLGQGLKFTWELVGVEEAAEDAEAQAAAEEAFEQDPNFVMIQNIFDRENWEQKFSNLKRWMEIRGDHFLMLIGDEDKTVPGTKISVAEIDPSTVYPYESPVEPGKILGYYLVDEFPKPGGKKGEKVARVQKYMKTFDEATYAVNPEGPITYTSGLYETGAWDDRPDSTLEAGDIKEVSGGGEVVFEKTLDPRIKSLPLYHFRGHPIPNAVFGRSGLAGLETLITSVSQTMTDEDLIMIFGGLGFYATDGGPPRDSRGNIVPWEISPLKMLETGKDDKVYRVNGVASLDPSQTHMEFAQNAMQQTKGIPDIAVGVVDAAVAESGIALELKMGAILTSAQEQELELKSVMKQFLYDLLTQWLPVYESVGLDDPEGKLKVDITFRDPKPVNQEKRFNQLLQMWDSGIISAKLLCEQLTVIMGFLITEEDFKQATEDKKSMAVAADPFGAAMLGEQGVPDPADEQTPPEGE